MMKKIILSIDGMTCSACSNGLEKYLNKQKGITNASVNLVMANALIEYDDTILNQKRIETFVKEAGFKSLGLFKESNMENKTKKERGKFIFFLVLAIVLMYISMGHMIGLPTIEIFNMHTHPIPYTIILFLLAIAFLIYGFDILKSGYQNFIHKTPNMDTLVSIGVLSSMLYSLYSMYMVFKGNYAYVENLYFESAAIVIFFIKLGRYMDSISKDKTKEAIQKLVKITPNHAIIKIDGIEKQVTLDEIQKGDIVVSKPGEKIAVDGEIISGKAHLDESFITGESKKAGKTIGEKVIAGSLNYDGYLEYKAERIGKESTISEIVRLVIEATNTKAPIAKIADKVSGYFVPAVIAIAIITFLVYLLLGYVLSTAVITFVTILVVACPCSLGLATPLAIVVSEGLCASNGILVKKSEILENAQKINTIVFDKTGTLTYGSLKIAEIMNYSNMEEKKLLQLVASIESKSTHPIGKAFTDYLQENKFVMMCGDGINDSPALASSDIGVSVNSGTDIAMDSSDVILTRNDLYGIINLINISKKTIRNIKQNLFWAFFYNSLMIPIAMGLLKPFGVSINPMIASFAMVISSFTVILNALRLRRITTSLSLSCISYL